MSLTFSQKAYNKMTNDVESMIQKSGSTLVPAIKEDKKSVVADVKSAVEEAINITKPAYKESKQDIQTLLGSARAQYDPVKKNLGFGTQLQDILAGNMSITDTPSFKAKSEALQNVLGFTGQTQSQSGTLAAYNPLIASEFDSLVGRAERERLADTGIFGSLASLFQNEASMTGGLPIAEAERVGNLGVSGATQMGQFQQNFSQLLANVGLSEQELGLKREELAQRIKEKDAKAQGDLLGGLLNLGLDYLMPGSGTALNLATQAFSGGGSDASAQSYTDYSGYS